MFQHIQPRQPRRFADPTNIPPLLFHEAKNKITKKNISIKFIKVYLSYNFILFFIFLTFYLLSFFI